MRLQLFKHFWNNFFILAIGWGSFFYLLTSCHSPTQSNEPRQFSQNVMTIDYHISIGDRLDLHQEQKIKKIIEDTFQEINAIYNKWNVDSELSRLNALPAFTPFQLSPELYQFLQQITLFVQLSDGRFDPTIEPLQNLWKQKLKQGQCPSKEEIEALKPCLGWNKLHFENGICFKADERTQLDLGGVAKGLCVDLLIERLSKMNLQHLFVEWGGEIRTLGYHPSGRPWRVYISHLENNDPEQAIAQIALSNQALATSGDYFQYWKARNDEGEEKIYCHVFDPRKFSPLEIKSGSIASASLLALDCVTADALAKVLMLFDSPEEAQAWVEKIQEKYPYLACWIATRPSL